MRRRGVDALVIAAYLGHVRLENTMRYVAIDAEQFEGVRD